MHISLEPTAPYTIEAYTQQSILINGQEYTTSFIVGQSLSPTPWSLHRVDELGLENINFILDKHPEIILIGRENISDFIPTAILEYTSQKRIGIECMNIGAACRTYNVLLNEGRRVILAILWP